MSRFKARHYVLLFPVVKTLDGILVVISKDNWWAARAGFRINIDLKLVFQFCAVDRYGRFIGTIRNAKIRVLHLFVCLVECRLTRCMVFTVQSPGIGIGGIPLSDIRYGNGNIYPLDIAAVYGGKDTLI